MKSGTNGSRKVRTTRSKLLAPDKKYKELKERDQAPEAARGTGRRKIR